jgi:anti-anti-sigma regulatory factor
MTSDACPVQWTGRQAIVPLPEHIGLSNAGLIGEELLSVINCGATTLIADMTATISCDHAGADAVARAFQRAVISGTELRLVVTAQIVRRVLGINVWVPETASPYATCAYSRMMPPRRSRRRTRMLLISTGGWRRPAGGSCCSDRCGRCPL